MGIFSRRSRTVPGRPATALVHLSWRLQPTHRARVFEDDLDELLTWPAPASCLIGGSTECTPEAGPLSCDVAVELVGDPERVLGVVIAILEYLGAPVGSWVQLDDGRRLGDRRPFGVAHGLALSLDPTSLTEGAEQGDDIEELIGALTSALGDDGELQSWWCGPERTALYFYGRDLDRLREVLESAPARSPLARWSRIEPIT